MRDYYLDFVSNRDEKTQKRVTREGAKGAEDPCVPFAPSADSEYPENSGNTRSDAAENSTVTVDEIFEERVAIMMFDGGLNEADAIRNVLDSDCH